MSGVGSDGGSSGGSSYGGDGSDSPNGDGSNDDEDDTKIDYECNPTVVLSNPTDCFLCSLQTHEQKGQQNRVRYEWNLAYADSTLQATLKHLDTQDDACIDQELN